MAKSGGATEKTNLFYPFHSPKLTFENTLLYDSLFFLYHTKSDEASSLSLEKSLRGYHHLKINQACFLNRFGAHRSHHCTVRLSSLKPEQQQLGKQLCKHCVLWAADGEASYPVLKCRDLNCTQSSVTAYMGKETKCSRFQWLSLNDILEKDNEVLELLIGNWKPNKTMLLGGIGKQSHLLQ